MIELKPCPFCGGEAVVDKYPVRGYKPAVSFEVRCSICGQRRAGGYFDTVYKSERWARRKAIEAWNTRPNPWNTETPFEEGWYLCEVISLEEDDEDKFIPYYILLYKNNEFRTRITDFVVPKEHIIKWQKIEPYNEANDLKHKITPIRD